MPCSVRKVLRPSMQSVQAQTCNLSVNPCIILAMFLFKGEISYSLRSSDHAARNSQWVLLGNTGDDADARSDNTSAVDDVAGALGRSEGDDVRHLLDACFDVLSAGGEGVGCGNGAGEGGGNGSSDGETHFE